jgi:hypothetical protein
LTDDRAEPSPASRLRVAPVLESRQPELLPQTRHSDGYPPGWHVRYRRRTDDSLQDWQEFTGTIAGPSLRDVHTDTTWTPVRPSGAGEYTPVQLVRGQDILEAQEGT